MKTNLFLLSLTAFILASCNGGDPKSKGTEAGKEACKCYQLDNFEAVDSCLKKIEHENSDFLNDTAYINAMEEQMLRCASEGVIDIVKPIKEAEKEND